MGQHVLGFEPQFLAVLQTVAEKENTLRFGKAPPAGQRVALVRTGKTEGHTEGKAFIFHAETAQQEKEQPKPEERRSRHRKGKQTHPRPKHAAGLHRAVFERIHHLMHGRAHVTQ